MVLHEYSVVGHSRATVGRYLGVVAGIVASVCALLVLVLLDVAKRAGLDAWIPNVILWPLSAAVIYPVGHTIFDLWAWRTPLMLRFLKIPDLNGKWNCVGRTLSASGETTFDWSGVVSISQTWEKLRIYLDTNTSRSSSVAAALVKEPGRGFLLMYSYRNEPRVGEQELGPHIGYCELSFNEQLSNAEGDYFNNKGRVTFGRMVLTRQKVRNGN